MHHRGTGADGEAKGDEHADSYVPRHRHVLPPAPAEDVRSRYALRPVPQRVARAPCHGLHYLVE